MQVRLSDTLSGRTIELDPSAQKDIRVYVCGVTVYDYSHVGHARTFIVFDVLRRVLMDRGFNVRYVQNFTDIDDKIIRRANEEGVSYREVAEKYIKEYLADSDALNIMRADLYPRATEHIGDMVEFIKGLLNSSHAYASSDGVYFSVKTFPEYGKLSKVKPEELIKGARVEVKEGKRDPLDFALWKFYDEGPTFESELGRGRPGWHIECSTMIRKNLGTTIDIHGGGEDLIFPHHENEIAQSESLTGKPLARIWMHVGLVKFGEEKMSKSLHNAVYIRDFLRQYGPNTLRVWALSTHYRAQVEFSERTISEAVEKWKAIEDALYSIRQQNGCCPSPSEVKEVLDAVEEANAALNDDLDTPRALQGLLRASRAVNRIWGSGSLGGEGASEIASGLERLAWLLGLRLPEIGQEEADEVERAVKKRNELRKERRFSEADRIRAELQARRIKLIDMGERTFWRKVEVI